MLDPFSQARWRTKSAVDHGRVLLGSLEVARASFEFASFGTVSARTEWVDEGLYNNYATAITAKNLPNKLLYV